MGCLAVVPILLQEACASTPGLTCAILVVQVWLAEWMSTQVAVKELVWFQDRDKERGPARAESPTNALAAPEESDRYATRLHSEQ